MITAYTFGRMEIDGAGYTTDLVIYPDGRVVDAWWRDSGHRLALSDIDDLLASRPETLLVGTGAAGMMTPDPALVEELRRRGIAFEALHTGEATQRYNALCRRRRVAACFHLTC